MYINPIWRKRSYREEETEEDVEDKEGESLWATEMEVIRFDYELNI